MRPGMNTDTKILTLLLLIAVGAVVAYTMFTIGAIVAMFMLSMLFAFILAPAVNWLEGRGLPRALAALVMFTVALAALALVVYLVAPLIYDELVQIQKLVTERQLRTGVRDTERFLSRQLSFLGVRRLQIAPKVEEWVGALFDNILGIASGLVGLVLFIVMTLISTFFLLKDMRSIKKNLIAHVPNRFFEVSLSVFDKIDWSLGAYLRGILLDASIIGIIAALALWAFGIPSFVLIGLVAAAANLVPYLGPPTAALVASIISIATTNSFDQVPIILVIFTAIRLLDDSVIQPLTISQSVRLHPVIIIFAILIGGQLFGILGMLFAVPVVGVVKVVLSELLKGLRRYPSIS
jgi:predicted PurR-regulated permease PerM